MDDEKLKEFLIWYWKEIDPKPYQISSQEIIGFYREDKNIYEN